MNFLISRYFSDKNTIKQCKDVTHFIKCFDIHISKNRQIEPEVVNHVVKLRDAVNYLKNSFCSSNETIEEFGESLKCFKKPLVIGKYLALQSKYKLHRKTLLGNEGFRREIECCLEYSLIEQVKSAVSRICNGSKFGAIAETLMQELVSIIIFFVDVLYTNIFFVELRQFAWNLQSLLK